MELRNRSRSVIFSSYLVIGSSNHDDRFASWYSVLRDFTGRGSASGTAAHHEQPDAVTGRIG
jgi:hypothetical protein